MYAVTENAGGVHRGLRAWCLRCSVGLGEYTGLASLGGAIYCEITGHWKVLAAESSNNSAIVNVAEGPVEIAAAENRVAGGVAVIGAEARRARSAVDFVHKTGLGVIHFRRR